MTMFSQIAFATALATACREHFLLQQLQPGLHQLKYR
jgi:hypothetical protein